MRRHYGMDWLRIAAFAILILYHIGMVFVPWPFHVKARQVEPWVVLPMLSVNAWRLTLLFVVSGYATRALLARSPGIAAFVRSRSTRLLVPLVFGVAVVIPPQAWVELSSQHGYRASFLSFWAGDYWLFRVIAGVALPSWNHLWFLLYLWIYTAVLALGLSLAASPRWQDGFDRVMGGWGVLAVPLAWFVAIHAWWFPMGYETHALFGDWIAHLEYPFALLFGFGLAGSPSAMRAIGRLWPTALALAVAGFAALVAIEADWFDSLASQPTLFRWYGAAHACQQWSAIVALIGLADRYLDRDHRWRATLTEGVFPFYIVHQTIIVVVAYRLRATDWPGEAVFAVLAAATIAGCALFYLVGRRIVPLRPLIGLRLHPRAASASAA